MANMWVAVFQCNSVLLGLLWGSKSWHFVIFDDDFLHSLTFLSYLQLFVLSIKSERGFASVRYGL